MEDKSEWPLAFVITISIVAFTTLIILGHKEIVGIIAFLLFMFWMVLGG